MKRLDGPLPTIENTMFDLAEVRPCDPAPADSEHCPKCGGDLIHGYGLMGGGVGAYILCETENCNYFHKEADKDES